MLKNALMSATILAGLSASALAADLPARRAAPVFTPVPVFTWTGFYLGVSGGGIFGENEIRTTGIAPGNIAAVAADARNSRVQLDNEGFLVGGTIGFNYQAGLVVFGVEGDISYTDMSSSITVTNPNQFGANAPGTLQNTFRQDMDYFATARGRLGLAFGNVLVYATGGAAFADFESSAEFSSPALGPTQFAGLREYSRTGYTVGGGVEIALPAGTFLGLNVSLKGEYLYYDFGSTTVAVTPTSTGVPLGVGGYNSRFENEGHIVRGGLNVKFGSF